MARMLRPICKQCRRGGEKLFLKAEKCYTEKCPLTKRGAKKRTSLGGQESTYSIQLKEKQKLKLMYGLLETQFKKFFRDASKKGTAGKELLKLLERRLDNVIFRLGWASSRKEARMMVTHRHIKVNGEIVDIPSYLIKKGEKVELKNPERPFLQQKIANLDETRIPNWISLNGAPSKAVMARLPDEEDIKDIPINTTLIVEFYSK